MPSTAGVVIFLLASMVLVLSPGRACSAEVFTGIKLAGAAHLVWLGVQTFRHRGDLSTALGTPRRGHVTGPPAPGAGRRWADDHRDGRRPVVHRPS
ncbi:hypothetical protein [Pseudonocardia sp.]|jgi:threonine/homoserine/homoserine lactone efflux protein|uniref:hypothetical protein n=1 Tax=Pseudonocardia sp. TaxID=60912 RepID=UPI002607FC37|nr:hypothetical protein [Pseudonocardia sp.]